MTAIRDATEDDLPRIVAITNDAILRTTANWNYGPVTLEQRRAFLLGRQQRGFPVLVADVDGAVTGFASYGDFRPFDGYKLTVEHAIYVDPAAHGRGIGKALLGELIDRAGRAGLHVMIGAIDAGNAVSIALYRRFGFVETGRMPEVGRKFDRWLDLVLMQKMLEETP
ncbi:MAG TPA: GNAT family N-acetyltransferase [Acidisphaera sp.]|nr:GNAT family N-acetyltransferase [Acidisphaera sp.]